MKKANILIEKVPTTPEEEKLFNWLESDECLGNWTPGEDATVLEKTKYQFCQAVTKYVLENNLSEEQVAERLNLNKLSTAKLLRGWTESFALDSLISYVEKLHLPLNIKIDFAPESERKRVSNHSLSEK